MIKLVKVFLTDSKWEKIRAVFWFCLITVVIHFAWRFWAMDLHYFPLKSQMEKLTQLFVAIVYHQSIWVIDNILCMDITTSGKVFVCPNNFGISINESCSGIKQILQFGLLMLVFPGSWKRKMWFIPLGMFVVHLTNILRILLLAVVANNWPTKVEYFHDNWLRIMFYVVIFGLWLLWVEKIDRKKTKSDVKN